MSVARWEEAMPPPDVPVRGASVEVAPGIYKTPDVCGGSACVGRFRIPVWVLEGYRRLGLTDAELLRAYPTLSPEHLAAARAYAAANPGEIAEEIRENDEA
jgi:uncharacterized protein (DUF433 family)